MFDTLYTLQKGDKVYVTDTNGVTTTFVLQRIATYGQYDDASEVFKSTDGGVHLNLITCEGVWDPVGAKYANRLVVFTDALPL